MKIFNWVQRRFTHKDGFSQNVKKIDRILKKDGDTQALLDNVVLADLLDGWKGGVLAIGTFGLDSFNYLKEENEYYCQYTVKDEEAFEEDEYLMEGESDDELDLDEEEEEEGELNPLVCAASINGHEGSNSDRTAPARVASSIMTIDGTPVSPRDDLASDSDSNKWNHHYMIKKERITLADLFSAESDHENINTKNKKAQPQLMSKKPNPDAAKHGQSFSKKLIPGVKDDARPLKKLHQLMKRMIRRKIHPDTEAKSHKDSQTKPSCATGILSDKPGNNESVSLLHIRGTNDP